MNSDNIPQPIQRERSGSSSLRITLPIGLALALLSGGGLGALTGRMTGLELQRRVEELEARASTSEERQRASEIAGARLEGKVDAVAQQVTQLAAAVERVAEKIDAYAVPRRR